MSLIAIGGSSGSGKSTAIRNLDPKETFIIQTIPKPLPFPKWKSKYPLMDKKMYKGNRYILFEKEHAEGDNPSENYMTASKKLQSILKLISIKKTEIKTIIIDDMGYLMSYEFLARAREKGYDRFSAIAQNFFNVIKVATALSEDLDIIVTMHVEVVDEIQKLKTTGKLVDNAIVVEGLFSIVLMSEVERVDGMNVYKFITQSDGTTTAKSPMGMFDTEDIENDLKIILKKIHEYEGE